MRRWGITLGLLVVAVVACGGEEGSGEEDGVISAEDLDSTKPLSDLSDREFLALCDYWVDALGGEGKVYECATVTLSVDSDACPFADLWPVHEGCSALVGEAKACARTVAGQLTGCDEAGGTPQACEVVQGCRGEIPLIMRQGLCSDSGAIVTRVDGIQFVGQNHERCENLTCPEEGFIPCHCRSPSGAIDMTSLGAIDCSSGSIGPCACQ